MEETGVHLRNYPSWNGDHCRAHEHVHSRGERGFYSCAIQADSLVFYGYPDFFYHFTPQDACIYILDLTCSLTSIMFMLNNLKKRSFGNTASKV